MYRYAYVLGRTIHTCMWKDQWVYSQSWQPNQPRTAWHSGRDHENCAPDVRGTCTHTRKGPLQQRVL